MPLSSPYRLGGTASSNRLPVSRSCEHPLPDPDWHHVAKPPKDRMCLPPKCAGEGIGRQDIVLKRRIGSPNNNNYALSSYAPCPCSCSSDRRRVQSGARERRTGQLGPAPPGEGVAQATAHAGAQRAAGDLTEDGMLPATARGLPLPWEGPTLGCGKCYCGQDGSRSGQ